MELISGKSQLAISGSEQLAYATNQVSLATNKNVVAASEIVIDNPEEVVIDKTLVVYTESIVKEKIIIPKDKTFPSHCQASADIQTDPFCPTDGILNDEMEFSSQASLDSKMELGSQESTESRMELCSQESQTSTMELSSQDSNLVDELNEDSLLKSAAAQRSSKKTNINLKDHEFKEGNSLKRKRVVNNEELSDKFPHAQEASLEMREKAVAIREANVFHRERNLGDAPIRNTKYINSKRKKVTFKSS